MGLFWTIFKVIYYHFWPLIAKSRFFTNVQYLTLNHIMENVDASSEVVAPALKIGVYGIQFGDGEFPGESLKIPRISGRGRGLIVCTIRGRGGAGTVVWPRGILRFIPEKSPKFGAGTGTTLSRKSPTLLCSKKSSLLTVLYSIWNPFRVSIKSVWK